jgi:hypothetical protein
MAEEIVEVTIEPDGTVKMRVSGVTGMSCLTETGDLIALLGGRVEAQELTGEAYAEVQQDQHERRQQLWQ